MYDYIAQGDSWVPGSDPNAEYQAAHEANVCVECHHRLLRDGRCPNEGACRRYRPEPEPRDTIQFDDEPPEDDSCPRCQDAVPGDQHAHHQIDGRWVPCHGEGCHHCEPAPQAKRTLSQAQRAHLQRIASKGGKARAAQFTAAHQSKAAKAKSSEAQSLAGKKGAQVTIERHGIAKLVEKMAAWRLDHPSRPEQALRDLLTANDFVEVTDSSAAHVEEFEREVPVDDAGLLRLDFGSRHWRWAIEVRGGCHDVWDTPAHEAKRLAVIHEAGWHVLVVRDSDLVNKSGKTRYAFGLEASVKDHIATAISDWFSQYRVEIMPRERPSTPVVVPADDSPVVHPYDPQAVVGIDLELSDVPF